MFQSNGSSSSLSCLLNYQYKKSTILLLLLVISSSYYFQSTTTYAFQIASPPNHHYHSTKNPKRKTHAATSSHLFRNHHYNDIFISSSSSSNRRRKFSIDKLNRLQERVGLKRNINSRIHSNHEKQWLLSTSLQMVFTTPSSIIEQASTIKLLDDLIDESVRTVARKTVMMQFDPSSGWVSVECC